MERGDTMSYITETFEISEILITVKYKKGCKNELKAKCETWLNGYQDEVSALLKKGSSRFIHSQLDLLDIAKQKVEGALLNCK